MKSAALTIVIDSREQTPWQFPDVETAPGTLAAGDYSLVGLEHLAAIERKSLPDLVACIGPERERFERELHRLQSYRCRCVIIEGTLSDVIAGNYRSSTTPSAVLGSVAAWQQRYNTGFVWAGDPAAAALFALSTFRAFLRDCERFAVSLGYHKPKRNNADESTTR